MPVPTPTSLTAALPEIERCYDAIPRTQGTHEQVGPFTLFLADASLGWAFYARPTLGEGTFTADDVRRVLARQGELGVPRAIEWVDDVTPSLLPAVREVLDGPGGPEHELELCPLLVLPADAVLAPTDSRVRVLVATDPAFAAVRGAIHAGFGESDDHEPRPSPAHASAVGLGGLVVVGAFADGVVGGGSASVRDGAAELMGIATLPRARRQGLGAAVTRELASACRAAGVATVYLAAASDDSAGVYRSVGFEPIGTACILGVSGA